MELIPISPSQPKTQDLTLFILKEGTQISFHFSSVQPPSPPKTSHFSLFLKDLFQSLLKLNTFLFIQKNGRIYQKFVHFVFYKSWFVTSGFKLYCYCVSKQNPQIISIQNLEVSLLLKIYSGKKLTDSNQVIYLHISISNQAFHQFLIDLFLIFFCP